LIQRVRWIVSHVEVRVIESSPSLQHADTASRFGIETWPRFLYVALIVGLVVNVTINAAWVITALGGLKDLDSFLHSGAAYAKGLDPYEYYWWLKPSPISAEALNLNPPISVYFFDFLSSMNRGFLGTAFLLGAIGMVGVCVGMLMRAYPDKRHWLLPLLVAGMAGIWQMLWYLQIYAPLLVAMTGAWLALRKENWLLGGLLLGVVIAIKPNYALLALIMIAAGHYRPTIAAVVTAGVISIVPLLIDGPHIYWQWLHLTESFNGYGWTSNASLTSVGERLNSVMVGQVAGVALALCVLYLARRWRPDTLATMALGTMSVILVGPVSWAGYTLLLLPYLFSTRWDRWTWIAVCLLVMPFAPGRAADALGFGSLGFGHVSLDGGDSMLPLAIVKTLGAVILPVIGAIYAWAVLILLVRLVMRLGGERGDNLPSLNLRGRFNREPRPRLQRVQPAMPITTKPRPQQGALPVRVRFDA
jgi:hypothetical protein